MSELLLELFCEEIPARMQARAAEDLSRLVGEGLRGAGLGFEGARAFATPRRLTLVVDGLPKRSPDRQEERKGPRLGAPDKAVEGFLRAAGLASLAEAEIVKDEKGRDYYLARLKRPGRPTGDVVAEIVPDVVRRFPWPKSMRWGAGGLRWVRPLHGILCLLDGRPVAFEVDGIKSGRHTSGHRFMAPKPFAVTNFADYAHKLREAKVMLDPAERRAAILEGARELAAKHKLALVEDEALLAENAGLTEWPVPLIGEFDPAFLDVPPEVLSTAMKAHQKCFSLREAGDGGQLANRFILVANLEAKDGGKAIAAGNARVINARLADAKFFWDQDRKTLLQDRVGKLRDIVFHDKLGTQYDRMERVRLLARELAPLVGAEADEAERAAILAKADLVTGMVGEFPELQGVMGRYYALEEGELPEVADAIAEHYRPQGPGDTVPTHPVSIAVALADKLDMLVGFWAIDEKPTGSKDPYALRRATLGVIRILLENQIRVRLSDIYSAALLNLILQLDPDFDQEVFRILKGNDIAYYEWHELAKGKPYSPILNFDGLMDEFADLVYDNDPFKTDHEVIKPAISKLLARAESLDGYLSAMNIAAGEMPEAGEKVISSLDSALPALREEYLQPALNAFSKQRVEFDADRLKVHLREQGARHDLIDAVFGLGNQDDLVMIVRRVEALGRFLETEDGANLLVGVKRAINILRIEEKKDGRSYDSSPDLNLLTQKEEQALARAIDAAEVEAAEAVAREDFEAAMSAIARLRAPVDAFFDHVTVNADDPALRENRLKLLNRIRAATLAVADFSRIAE